MSLAAAHLQVNSCVWFSESLKQVLSEQQRAVAAEEAAEAAERAAILEKLKDMLDAIKLKAIKVRAWSLPETCSCALLYMTCRTKLVAYIWQVFSCSAMHGCASCVARGAAKLVDMCIPLPHVAAAPPFFNPTTGISVAVRALTATVLSTCEQCNLCTCLQLRGCTMSSAHEPKQAQPHHMLPVRLQR